jgi:hypothetical protein
MATSSDRPYALDVIRPWPDAAREAAYQVILVHGAPDELDSDALCWRGIGPWKRVVVCAADGEDPSGVIESVIDATVPEHRRDEVDAVAEEFRVHLEDDGEVSVRGPDLFCNAITLNAIHGVVHGLSAEEARDQRARDLSDLREGHPARELEMLRFADDAPHGEPSAIRTGEEASEDGPEGTQEP